MKKHIGKRALAVLAGAAVLLTGTGTFTAFADAGEDPGKVADEDKKFPDTRRTRTFR